MKHWSSDKSNIARALKNRKLALFLDFDGTLVPLKPFEKEADLSMRRRKLLSELACHPAIKVAIISGRPTADLKSQVRDRQVYIAGNHGLEILGRGISFLHPSGVRAERIFRRYGKDLSKRLAGVAGVCVEYKIYSLSVHYRGAIALEVRQCLREWLMRHGLNRSLSIKPGKNVWELRPFADWHKGRALRHLLTHWQDAHCFPIYMGDDLTDEDALAALPQHGWGFKVTPEPDERSKARSWIKNPSDVESCLRWFKSLMK